MTKPVTRKMAVDCLLDRAIGWYGALPCSVCKMPLLPGQNIHFDHVHSDVMGGPHEYRNLRPIHYDPCHKQKTKKDVQANSKVNRLTGKTGKKRSRKMPTGKKLQSRGFQKRVKT